MTRTCKYCGESKDIECFQIIRNKYKGHINTSRRHVCIKCMNNKFTIPWISNNRQRFNENVNKWISSQRQLNTLSYSRKALNTKNIPLTIDNLLFQQRIYAIKKEIKQNIHP